MKGSQLPRVLGAWLLALILAGPTPGAVGSCGADPLDGPADLASYCKEREQFICRRRWLRREITEDASNECRRDVLALCDSRTWSPQCRPTERQAQACLNALQSTDTLQTPENELDECKTAALCKLPDRPDSGAGSP